MEPKKRLTRLNQMENNYDEMCKHLNSHKKRNEDVSHINHKIYYLLLDPFTFVKAYREISKNIGALTKESTSNKEMMEDFGKINAENIARKFKTGTYKWNPIKGDVLPQLRNQKMTSIDTPNLEDRIVKEAIKEILESIYETEFREFQEYTQSLCSNYDFRTNPSPYEALNKLKTDGQKTNFGIKGDMVSAYNNLDHDILLKFLSKRIKDKKFLKVINEMLQSGIMHENTNIHNLVGIPKGGIVSHILFNIYMLEFDKFVFNDIILPRINEKIRRETDYQKTKYETKSELQRSQINQNMEKTKPDLNTNKKLQKAHNSLLPNGVENLPKFAVYTRYSNAWLLLISSTQKETIQIHERIRLFLEKELKLELDPEQTHINKLINGIDFLGYHIRSHPSEQILKYGEKEEFLERKITITADKSKVLNTLIQYGFCTKNGYDPIGVRSWAVFNEYQIVLKYRKIMVGLFNYYSKCDSNHFLNRVNYILRYSCAKTIAIRKKIPMAQVFSLYGRNLKIEIQKRNLTRTYLTIIEFPTLKNLKLSMTKKETFNLRNQLEPKNKK